MFSLNPNLHGKNAHIVRPYRKHRTHHRNGIFVFLRHPVVCISVHDVMSGPYDRNLLTPAVSAGVFQADGSSIKQYISINCVAIQPDSPAL
jgi:hypothetical protein